MSNRFDDYDRHREDRFDRYDDRERQRRRFNRSANDLDRSENRGRFSSTEQEHNPGYISRSLGRGYTPSYGMESDESYGTSGRRSSRMDRDDSDYRQRSGRNYQGSGRDSDSLGRSNYDSDRSMSRYGANFRPNFEAADDAYGSYDTFVRDHPDARPYDYGYGSGGRNYSGQRNSSYGQRDYSSQSPRDYSSRGYSSEQRRRPSDDSRRERSWWEKVTDEVASWFGDDDAEQRRRGDEHLGTHRGKGPRGYKRSDERIREEINDRLTDYPYLDATDIVASVDERVVTLTGSVDSRWARRAAEEVVDTVSGVEDVNNQLRVIRNQSLTQPGLTETSSPQTATTLTQPSTSTTTDTPGSTKTRTKTAGL